MRKPTTAREGPQARTGQLKSKGQERVQDLPPRFETFWPCSWSEKDFTQRILPKLQRHARLPAQAFPLMGSWALPRNMPARRILRCMRCFDAGVPKNPGVPSWFAHVSKRRSLLPCAWTRRSGSEAIEGTLWVGGMSASPIAAATPITLRWRGSSPPPCKSTMRGGAAPRQKTATAKVSATSSARHADRRCSCGVHVGVMPASGCMKSKFRSQGWTAAPTSARTVTR